MFLFVSMVILVNKRLAHLLFAGCIIVAMSFVAQKKHPYHVSATEIEYNAANKQVEICSKIFADDFEKVLMKVYKIKADFSDTARKAYMHNWVNQYITTHLSLRSNGLLLPLVFVGCEVDREAVYVYATAAANHWNAQNISIENTILYDLFTDQMNIIHCSVNGKRQSTKLNYPERKWQISF